MTEREREESRYRDERDRDRDRDRERDRESRDREYRGRLPTPQTEYQYTRRVRTKYDNIFDDDNDSFDEIRNPSQVAKKPIRRVKEVFEKKGITEAITEMFADHFEDLMLFMKQRMEEKKKEETVEEEKDDRLQAYIDKIRRVSCYRVNKKRHSPVMMGRLLGRSSNKKEVFIADMGSAIGHLRHHSTCKHRQEERHHLDPDRRR